MVNISPNFFLRTPLEVAPDLLGKILVRKLDDEILSGRIVEVEAYLGSDDPASHAFKGKTLRNASLFQTGGHAYIYQTRHHFCLDIVTEVEHTPHSVLVRALEPLTGIEQMKLFRGKENLRDLTSGPGKLCQALQLTKAQDGISMTDPNSELVIVDYGFHIGEMIQTTRVGISKAKDNPWRWYVKDNPFVSRK